MKFLLIILFAFSISNIANGQNLGAIQAALSGISDALKWAKTLKDVGDHKSGVINFGPIVALGECIKLYEDSEARLERLVDSSKNGGFSSGDAVAWLSGAMAGNNACLDGLTETGLSVDTSLVQKLNYLLERALAGGSGSGSDAAPTPPDQGEEAGILATWNSTTSKADAVVAQDGSGQYKTINEAVTAVAAMGPNRPKRTIIYVKSGTYDEQVYFDNTLDNLMFVGDGIGRTIITGSRSLSDSGTTPKSATFSAYGDSFWARDITFRNTAGPEKGQAVALGVSADQSVIYRCSIEGYQDTLLAWRYRQFYRDCQIHGTIDYLFGDAAAIFQNCDIIVRVPLSGQYNTITAQGRDSSFSQTGFVIMDSRVIPDPDFAPKKYEVKTYLGRPWQRSARVLYTRTYMDDMVDPRGWMFNKGVKPRGMFFGEFRDIGKGADTDRRVRWPFYRHVKIRAQIDGYSVRNFLQGLDWLPASGVPFSADNF